MANETGATMEIKMDVWQGFVRRSRAVQGSARLGEAVQGEAKHGEVR